MWRPIIPWDEDEAEGPLGVRSFGVPRLKGRRRWPLSSKTQLSESNTNGNASARVDAPHTPTVGWDCVNQGRC
jgi:hypothetical protein